VTVPKNESFEIIVLSATIVNKELHNAFKVQEIRGHYKFGLKGFQ
jgi:hypothetical protein